MDRYIWANRVDPDQTLTTPEDQGLHCQEQSDHAVFTLFAILDAVQILG